jgi:DNA-binding beta-propeller fold protein YncE
MTRRNILIGTGLITAFIALGAGQAFLDREVAAQGTKVESPTFEVDPFWPKPLPNHWLIGSTIGVSVDAQDNVWIIHRPDTLVRNEVAAAATPPTAECCFPAPPVLVFDPAGNLVNHWGGPGEGYEWPQSNHGVTVDYKGNVWIGGNGQKDAQVLKFTREGKFLLQIGHQGKNGGSNDVVNLGRPAKIFVDRAANEAYIADGYGNKRVIVYDADSGHYKRHWGAYGNKPDDTNFGPYVPDGPPPQQFRNPVHCSEISVDNLVYVCDRVNDRIQVFQKNGTFVKEVFVAKNTLASGSAWDVAFSKDPEQRFLYLADGSNEKVYILRRDTLELLTSFGDGGRQPGQFFGVHSIAVDSKGNLYTTETYEGKRLQKFVYKGLGTVTKKDQGTLWPQRPL